LLKHETTSTADGAARGVEKRNPKKKKEKTSERGQLQVQKEQ